MVELWHHEKNTHALKDLFTSDVGLLSLAVLVFMLGMGVFFMRYFIQHMREDTKRAAAPAAASNAACPRSCSNPP
ncbi:MAG: DUF3149 domain-containing protein [Rubrivivax sp.]|nr:DUF3149 domain-containing protein [Rubrivivax sp.]MDP3615023.1 DUF3149 domain-containing protein [Rubrivivax sp.]